MLAIPSCSLAISYLLFPLISPIIKPIKTHKNIKFLRYFRDFYEFLLTLYLYLLVYPPGLVCWALLPHCSLTRAPRRAHEDKITLYAAGAWEVVLVTPKQTQHIKLHFIYFLSWFVCLAHYSLPFRPFGPSRHSRYNKIIVVYTLGPKD